MALTPQLQPGIDWEGVRFNTALGAMGLSLILSMLVLMIWPLTVVFTEVTDWSFTTSLMSAISFWVLYFVFAISHSKLRHRKRQHSTKEKMS